MVGDSAALVLFTSKRQTKEGAVVEVNAGTYSPSG
jgi:hypothetical protein